MVKKGIIISLSFLTWLIVSVCYGENVRLTGYYPSVFGDYEQLRFIPRETLSNPCAVGSIYVSSTDNFMRYCYDNGFGIGSWDYLFRDQIGDLDLDGQVTMTDADIISKVLSGKVVIDIQGGIIPIDTWRGDVDGNGRMTINDSIILTNYLSGVTANSPEDRRGWFYATSEYAALTIKGAAGISGDMGFGSSDSHPGFSGLGISGSMAIGNNFYDILAPANGLIVQGNVGIGTTLGVMPVVLPLTFKGSFLRGLFVSGTGTEINFGGTTEDFYTTIGGGMLNRAFADYATVRGGVSNSAGFYATIGGGGSNAASKDYSTIAGGESNTTSKNYATILGGRRNSAEGQYATIIGGYDNRVSGTYSFVGGGRLAKAGGYASVVAGGERCETRGHYSWVAGQNMYLNNMAERTFVWGHSANMVTISASDAFIIYSGQVGIGVKKPSEQLHLSQDSAAKPGGGAWTVSSDRRHKKHIKPIEGALRKMLELREIIFRWKEPEKHGNLTGTQMGMIAQEVEKVFPQWVDTDGKGYKMLTFRGFEALTVEALRELKEQIDDLKEENELLRKELVSLEETEE